MGYSAINTNSNKENVTTHKIVFSPNLKVTVPVVVLGAALIAPNRVREAAALALEGANYFRESVKEFFRRPTYYGQEFAMQSYYYTMGYSDYDIAKENAKYAWNFMKHEVSELGDFLKEETILEISFLKRKASSVASFAVANPLLAITGALIAGVATYAIYRAFFSSRQVEQIKN